MFLNHHGGGHQRSTIQCDEPFVRIQARRHHFATQLLSKLLNATGLNVSTRTIRNRLHDTGLRTRKSCIHILLSRECKQHQFISAQDHVNWHLQDCKPILFTDESRYCLDFNRSSYKSGESQGSNTMILKSVCMTAHGLGHHQLGGQNGLENIP